MSVLQNNELKEVILTKKEEINRLYQKLLALQQEIDLYGDTEVKRYEFYKNNERLLDKIEDYNQLFFLYDFLEKCKEDNVNFSIPNNSISDFQAKKKIKVFEELQYLFEQSSVAQNKNKPGESFVVVYVRENYPTIYKNKPTNQLGVKVQSNLAQKFQKINNK